MLKICLGLYFLSLTFFSFYAYSTENEDPIKWNLSGSHFMGSYCSDLKASDIMINNGIITINVNRLDPLTDMLHSQTCTIKIPYTSYVKTFSATATLSGYIDVSDNKKLVASLSVATAGTMGGVTSFSETDNDTGFQWSSPFLLTPTLGERSSLKITFSLVVVAMRQSQVLSSVGVKRKEDRNSPHHSIYVAPQVLTISNLSVVHVSPLSNEYLKPN